MNSFNVYIILFHWFKLIFFISSHIWYYLTKITLVLNRLSAKVDIFWAQEIAQMVGRDRNQMQRGGEAPLIFNSTRTLQTLSFAWIGFTVRTQVRPVAYFKQKQVALRVSHCPFSCKCLFIFNHQGFTIKCSVCNFGWAYAAGCSLLHQRSTCIEISYSK